MRALLDTPKLSMDIINIKDCYFNSSISDMNNQSIEPCISGGVKKKNHKKKNKKKFVSKEQLLNMYRDEKDLCQAYEKVIVELEMDFKQLQDENQLKNELLDEYRSILDWQKSFIKCINSNTMNIDNDCSASS